MPLGDVFERVEAAAALGAVLGPRRIFRAAGRAGALEAFAAGAAILGVRLVDRFAMRAGDAVVGSEFVAARIAHDDAIRLRGFESWRATGGAGKFMEHGRRLLVVGTTDSENSTDWGVVSGSGN